MKVYPEPKSSEDAVDHFHHSSQEEAKKTIVALHKILFNARHFFLSQVACLCYQSQEMTMHWYHNFSETACSRAK
jgi:hypothetical protein